MSTWSQIVVDLHKEGYTPEEIQERIALPLVTAEYVKNVLSQYNSFGKYRWQGTRFQKIVPAEGTLNRFTYNKVQELGGNDMLLEVLKTKSQYTLAREWGVPRNSIINYLRDFIRGGLMVGSWHSDRFYYNRRTNHQNKLTIKDVRNLW